MAVGIDEIIVGEEIAEQVPIFWIRMCKEMAYA
jgi:hypothetical protein